MIKKKYDYNHLGKDDVGITNLIRRMKIGD